MTSRDGGALTLRVASGKGKAPGQVSGAQCRQRMEGVSKETELLGLGRQKGLLRRQSLSCGAPRDGVRLPGKGEE